MSLQVALIWAVQALIIFAVSTFLFDALHYLLHRWRTSRFALLRKCAEMHWVHHEFLDRNMRVNPRWVRANLFAHVLPEFLTGIGGSLIFLLIFDWPTVAFVVAVRLVFLVLTIREEGIDFNHMSLERVKGSKTWCGWMPIITPCIIFFPTGSIPRFSTFLTLFSACLASLRAGNSP